MRRNQSFEYVVESLIASIVEIICAAVRRQACLVGKKPDRSCGTKFLNRIEGRRWRSTDGRKVSQPRRPVMPCVSWVSQVARLAGNN